MNYKYKNFSVFITLKNSDYSKFSKLQTLYLFFVSIIKKFHSNSILIYGEFIYRIYRNWNL